ARDSQWLAELLAHGLIRPSFVPPRETRDLRDLTRYRVKLTEERNRIHNRIHKVLEDACIKLDTVATNIYSRRQWTRHDQSDYCWQSESGLAGGESSDQPARQNSRASS